MSTEVLIAGDHSHEWWIYTALEYLPDEVLTEEGGNIAIVSLGALGAGRLPEQYRQREVVVLSDWIFPPAGRSEGDATGRCFICTLLHEIAHAVQRHKSGRLDKLTPEEAQAQEEEADALAVEWFNRHVDLGGTEHMKPIDTTEFRGLVDRFAPLFEEMEKFKADWHASR